MPIKQLMLVWAMCLIMLVASAGAFADSWKHYHPIYLEPQVTEVTNVTELTRVTEIVNTTNIANYTPDHCQGVAIAQAGANNQMYFGTKKPQLSIGVGECDGEFASSLMFGMRINNNLLLNGSYAADESVNAFGFGLNVIFK